MKIQILKFMLLISILFNFESRAQWVKTSFPYSLNVMSLLSNNTRIFAGTYDGMFISINNGNNWTLDTLGMGTTTILSMLIFNSNIFVGTNQGVYISTNNGNIWLQTSLNNLSVWSLLVNGSKIFAGTNNGVYFSSNNGNNWIQTSLNDGTVYSLVINSSYIFAGMYSYTYFLYFSSNNGNNWNPLTSYNGGSVYGLVTNGNYIFAGTTGTGVFMSSNNGTNWTQTSLGLNIYRAFAISGTTYVITGTASTLNMTGIWVSSNNGGNWTQRNEGLTDLSIMSLIISNDIIFAGTDSSVWRRQINELIGIRKINLEMPNDYSLSQNYSNPFNPITKIKFEIPLSRGVDAESGRGVLTKLIIYDILGREVATLVNEKLSPGTYEVEWDGSNYPSGVYFYKLIVLDPETSSGFTFSQTKKLILLK